MVEATRPSRRPIAHRLDRDLLSFGQAQMFVLCHGNIPIAGFPTRALPRPVMLRLPSSPAGQGLDGGCRRQCRHPIVPQWRTRPQLDPPAPLRGFFGRFRAVAPASFANAVVVLYAVSALLGATLYLCFRAP